MEKTLKPNCTRFVVFTAIRKKHSRRMYDGISCKNRVCCVYKMRTKYSRSEKKKKKHATIKLLNKY